MYNIDIETFSDRDLKKVGVYKYIESPVFEILLFGVQCGNSYKKVYDIKNGEKLPDYILKELQDPKVIKRAWNATFERLCLNKFYGIETKNWKCTQLKAMVLGLPKSLGKCGKALELEQQKIKTNLVNYFSKPKKDGTRNECAGEKWEEFKVYCGQDVAAEYAIDSKLPNIPIEWALYEHNAKINDKGIMVDLDLVDAAIKTDNRFKAAYMDNLISLTGLENPNSDVQFKKWMGQRGKRIDSLAKDKIPKIIEDLEKELTNLKDNLDFYYTNWEIETMLQALDIRQSIKKTSVAKYNKIRMCVCFDSRIRGLLQFYGANGTGRYAGRLVQTQNLYRPSVDGEELNQLRYLIKAGKDPRPTFGLDALSQAIRTCFIAEDGLTSMDWSAIEARILSYLANEKWRLEVFATHGKIYEAAAARLFGVNIDDVTKEQRAKGKVSELALGYNGGVGALRRMGADGSDEELDEIKHAWRRACPNIVQLWRDVQDAVEKTLTYKTAVKINKHLKTGYYTHDGNNWLVIQLPSKRCLYYFEPSLGLEGIEYYKPIGSNFVRTYGYGGKFVENIVQAMARDCLVVGLMRLQHLPIVMHVHDEIIIEGNHMAEAKREMEKPISWVPGLILKADGYYNDYYKK